MSTGETLDQLILGAGVDEEHLRIISPMPKNHKANVEIIREELAHDGPSVIIARRTCLEAIKRA
jgi:indolepyruvate ferredoxin oxidoreductase alpha subunit